MANRNGLPFKLVVTLLFLLPLGACFESSEEVESNFGGSVGDGPITGALIEVWTADGRLVTNQRSDTSASYQIKLKAKRGDYPLILTTKGGTDLVTNAEPDFELVSTLARPGKNKIVNLNPFSTFAVRTAQAMPGGLTEANVAAAHNFVMNELSFGLDTALISNSISGQVDNSNVAAVIKASESVGEMLRRTYALLSSTGSPESITDVINSLSDDLMDGVLDGRGAGTANSRIAALSRVVSAQVLLETVTNSLHVNGVLAVDAMDAAISVVTNGTGTQSTRDVPVTAGMLAELAEALRAAAVLGFPNELTAAISIVQGIEAGTAPAQVIALLPAGLGTVLDSLVVMAGSATSAQIEEINDLARMNSLPPIGAIEHEITITVQAGGSVLNSASAGECTSTCTITIADGEALILTPHPDSGFTFAGWGGACSGTAECTLTVTSNLSVTAEFAADTPAVPTHFLSLTLTGNGSVLVAPDRTLCEGNCLIEFDEGQVVTLSSTPGEGFAFDAWSGDCVGADACTLTMTSDQQVNASFSALTPPPPATNTITMSVVGQGSIALSPIGTICDSACTVTVEDSTIITAVAEPSPGHVFDAWGGDCAGADTCTLTMTADQQVLATFSALPPPSPSTHTITMSVVGQGSITLNPTGTLCDSACTVTVEDATVITAVADPSPDHVFDVWSGDCSGGGSCQLTVSSNKSLVATFSEEPPPVTNEPPVAIATANTFVTTGAVVSVSGAGSFDANEDPLTFSWVLSSKPANSSAILSWSDSASTQFQADMPGAYTVQLVVNDGQASSASDSVTITASEPTNGSLITELTISNTSTGGTIQQGAPVTFGHPFKAGEIQSGMTLAAKTASGETVPLQTDAKAFHADGSIRHAILTALLPEVPASGSASLQLVSSPDSALNGFVSLADIPAEFDAVLTANIGGSQYSASARDLLATTSPKLWLDGPLVAEWQVAGPLMNNGQAHPHLQARFYVRAYAGMDSIRVSVVLENNWTWQPNPSNFNYDLNVEIDGVEVFSRPSVNHYGHARWRKVFWSGVEPDVHIAHDSNYLIATKAVPNYDRTVTPSQAAISSNYTALSNKGGLMQNGLYRNYFPETGAHQQIGPLPAWSALYILSQDPIAKKTEIWNSEQAGSFSMHYRDKDTDLPVTITDYPEITTHSNAASSQFYIRKNNNSPYSVDTAHQGSMGYLAYLITGDYYFLEEMQFWANQNSFGTGPNYRGYEKGWVSWQQVRGRGWSMRSLSQTAYITPDSHPLKGYFTTLVENNNARFKELLVDADRSHKAPGNLSSKWWMDDFFTYSMGQTVEMGFTSATPVLEYMAQGPIGRMTAPGFCWIKAAPYEASGSYPTWAEVFATHWPHLVGLACNSPEFAAANGSSAGNMGGYADEPTGFGANMQPGLAAAVDSGIPNGQQAWALYETRSPKQDYSRQPQFAVVPRSR